MKDLSGMEKFAAEAIMHDTVSFIAWHPDGRLLTANPEFHRLTGYMADEAGQIRWPGDFTSKGLGECIARGMKERGVEERSCQCEGDIVRKDRSLVPVSVFLHMYHPGHREAPLYYAFITDISRLKEQEGRLQLTQYAVDHFTDSSIWLDSSGRIVYVNEEAIKLLGYTRDELLALAIWDIDPRYPPRKYEEVWAHARKGGWAHLESTLVGKDGRKVPVEVHSSYIRFGVVERLIAFLRDVTERKRAEQALVESEEKFRVLADTALAAIFLVAENRFFYANPAAQRLLGYTAEELYRMDYWDVVSPEFRGRMIDYGDRLLRGEPVPGRFEIRFVRKDGGSGWGDISIAPVRYPGRRGMAGVITALDVTERKRAEQALVESEEKFRVLAELLPTAIFLYQGEKLVYANPAGVRFTGFTEEEIRAKNFWDMVHPEYREMVKRYGLARQRGEQVPMTYDIKYVTRGGEERWAEFTAGYIVYKGRAAGVVTAVDITDRKRAELELLDAKAQAELYLDLMGHDINNMNMTALGFMEMAREKLMALGAPASEAVQLLASVAESLNNSARLIGSVRKLQQERRGGLKLQVICLNPMLAEVRERYAKVPGRDIDISYAPAGDCRVVANELLVDVFENIVGNAIKHSRGPLAINIRLDRSVERGAAYCRVAIEDTGPGIPDDLKRKIFARAGGERMKLTGKGLGLYLVKTLVEDYSGRVWVEDRVPGDPTKGARFVVVLPEAGPDGGLTTGRASAGNAE